jgi:LuxR family transcriptional regulator, maltose regulon positive regulatory protein
LQQGLRAHRSEPEAAQWTLWLGVQARLMLAQDNLTSARALLEEAHRERYPHARMPALERWLLVVESEVDLMADRPELVQRRYGGLGRRELSFPERILLARAALVVRDLSGAEALLAWPGSLMAETVATVEAGIVTALIADAEGHGLRCADALAKAIALAAREGIRQPFLSTSGGRLDALLARQSLLAPDDASFVADLMQTMSAAGTRSAKHRPAGELSDRETEVLQYLPTMLTAAKIAEELGVSVNTVKAHMRAIYRKLGAGRRRQAVVRARELGFV